MDEDELEFLKDFVFKNLIDDETIKLRYESGRTTTKVNLAPIIQIGLALKKMTMPSES